MPTPRARRFAGSGADDAWAVIGAILSQTSQGLVEQQEQDRIRKRQDEAALETKRYHDMVDADRDADRALRREAAATATRTRASAGLDQLREDVGGGGVDLDPTAAILGEELAGQAGRPSAIVSQPRPAGPAILGLPAPTFDQRGPSRQFRRNPAEEKLFVADQRQAEIDKALDALLPTLPPHTQQAVTFARTAGRPIPAMQPSDFETPKTPEQLAAEEASKREAAFGDFKRRTDYTESVRAGREAKTVGPPKDSPQMPRGVLAYLGQLTAKYGSDRAAAEDELRRALPNLQRDHPNLDLADLRRQFAAVFPKPEDDGLGLGPAAPVQRPAAVVPPAGQAGAGVVAPPGAAAAPPGRGPATPAAVEAIRQQIRQAMAVDDKAKVAALRQQYVQLTTTGGQ